MAAPTEHVEIERKYDATGSTLDLATLDDVWAARSDVGALGEATLTELDATYFDTEDLILVTHRVTLRRRTGGEDAGWHLKLPVSGDERRELRRPLDGPGDVVPDELLDRVRGELDGRPVVAVAMVRTTRLEREVVSDDGAVLAVVAEDQVLSRRLVGDGANELTWRELEVELVDGGPEVLDVIETLLTESGVVPSVWRSKLARALGDAVPVPSDALAATKPRKATVGDVLLAYLHEQVAQLRALDAAARVDAPDAVHDMRVATRRLRSQLATYRPVLDRPRTDPVRDELRWLGAVLGRSRDAEVMRERMLRRLDELPTEFVVGPVRDRVETELADRHGTAHRELVEALDSGRCARLLDSLAALTADPPLVEKAARRARAFVPELVDKAARRVDRAAAHAASAPPGDETQAALHAVRKAAKRARYAAESAAPVSGRQADRLAKRMGRLQDVLGEHQDAATARRLLPELARVATAAGESAYTYGVLHGVESASAEQAVESYPDALRATQRPKVRDWCS